VREKDHTREKLIDVYETLSPFQRALVQLSSVIYESTTPAVILKCLQRMGLTFDREKVTTAKALMPHLQKLQELGFLTGAYDCNEAFVEVATRKAVEEGRSLTKGIDWDDMDSLSAWRSKRFFSSRCRVCEKEISGTALKTEKGLLCTSCILTELRAAAAMENMSGWLISRLKEALSPSQRVRERLIVLWRFKEVQQLIFKQGGKLSDEKEMLELLVRNLGYVEEHPLASRVREAAHEVCLDLGSRMIALLLSVKNPEPWQYYANIILTASAISPDNRDVQILMEKAARDSELEIRIAVLKAISKKESTWSRKILQLLSVDPNPSIRKQVKNVISDWKLMWRGTAGQGPVVQTPLGPFGAMVKAVQAELPLESYYFYDVPKHCARLFRDARIAIYSRNTQLFTERMNFMASRCSSFLSEHDPIVQVCNNPFDTGWFRTMSHELQVMALPKIFYHAMMYLESDGEALAYAMNPEFRSTLLPEEKPLFYYHLTARLIIGGRLDEARKVMSEVSDPTYSGGVKGWIDFLEGRNNEAIVSFDSDLKEMRRRTGKRNIFYSGMGGLYYILALLGRQDISLLKQIDQYVTMAMNRTYEYPFLASCYTALKSIVHVQDLDPEKAREILSKQISGRDALTAFFAAFAAYWLDNRLSPKRVEALKELFEKARENSLVWLAMEYAELLDRTGEKDPVYRDYALKVQNETGIRSLHSLFRMEAPWEKSLRALIQTTTGEHPAGQKASEFRMIWLVDFQSGRLDLRPVEQKLTAKGGWSKGRTIALNRLFGGTDLNYLGKQDQQICAAVERDLVFYYRNAGYHINLLKALPALIGHPLLFLEKSPSTPVEIVKGQPEIMVTQAGSELTIKYSTPVTEEPVAVVQETPTRFRVMQLSDEHRRIAKILGEKGLKVPSTAREDVLKAITTISNLVTVQSAIGIGATSEDLVATKADPTPHVHLMPAGPGFRIEMFVKPFAEGGPYLKPGKGAENLIADIEGTRMQAKRNLKTEKAKADAVEATCPTLTALEESDRQWYIDDPQECLQLLLDLKTLQEKGSVFVEWPEGEKLKVTREISFDKLKMTIRGKTDWFEVGGQLQVNDDMVLDMKRLLELLQGSDTRFIPLGEGQFLALTKELRKRLEELNAFAEKRGKEVRLHPLAALALEDFTESVSNLEVDEAWKARLNRIHVGQELNAPLPSTLMAQLRDYQTEGYQWLMRLAYMGMGACLADDMGLGKTVQALAAILARAPQGPTLVVAPTSVCMNWVTEAARFAPTLNITLFGSGDRETVVKGQKELDVLICSYGLLLQEAELLASVQWHTIVLDEAQAIKNVTAKRSQAAMNLQGDFKLITTGTPIENHLSEFWTLFNFINPGLLGSHKRFNERFAIPIERYTNRDARKRLKKLIQPFILRRLKSQVLEELPPRTEVILQVEMSPGEMAFYEALRLQALENLEHDDSPMVQKQLKILAEIMKLRQAACNPRLVRPEVDLSSSKLELFGEVISELLENQHKALVFSQFVGHLNLIREYLDEKKIKYRYLDGSTPQKERKKEVDSFQAGDGDLFLISLKAGGLGLNLTAADYVIHMDPWWNPAVEDQASDRAHRIGQQRPVTVYRLVAKNTIEEKIVKLHQEKRDLAGSLLDGTDISGRVTAEELLKLIREQ